MEEEGSSVRVLGVDDSPIVRSVVLLAFAGTSTVEVHVEGDSELGLAEAVRADEAGERYACFVLDVDMPPFDGLELAARLRAIPAYAEAPIVFLSADQRPALQSRIARLGATLVEKTSLPTLRKSLLDVVQQAVAQSEVDSDFWTSS
ncbi:MAG: response regulator [Myxococcales bacterium]|nr:response regulator [Myxococcales bacterium]